MRSCLVAFPLALAAAVAACGPGVVIPQTPEGPGPTGSLVAEETLGEDALLVALPSDDNTLVGKVHVATYGADSQSAEAAFQANPCREHLQIQRFPASRKLRDIRRFSTDVNSSALLKVVKIGVSVSNVTDYQYEFNVTEKMVADDTIAYAECCARSRGGCGEHFVRELYYGEGVYRLLRSTSGAASVGVPMIVDVGGGASYAVLGEQSFRGYFAYKIKQTPAAPPPPSEDRVATIATGAVADLNLPATLEGAALLEQQGPLVLITTKSTERTRGDQLKAIGEARQQQRKALKNLLAGPPYNTPPAALNDRVERVYDLGQEVDASQDGAGDWLLKMSYAIR
ncbi:MAG: hypothetical protein M0R80_12165 [Proteobacteria bacterium]|jgi:hypothetical protein|nr:hypothetical protein [Pseudomonadota bacterium]